MVCIFLVIYSIHLEKEKIMNSQKTISNIYMLLLSLGIPPNCYGFHQIAYALLLCINNQCRLQCVTKCLYPDVARHFKTSHLCVERNIRTAINNAWIHNPNQIISISSGFFSTKPTATEFLSVMTIHLLK